MSRGNGGFFKNDALSIFSEGIVWMELMEGVC